MVVITLVVSLRCLAFRESLYDQIGSKTTHTNTLFVQFFVKKNRKNRLSANTTRGSIANITSYWYRVEENFMGFPTKKTACKSEQNSLQAWPICQGMYVHFCQLWPILGALSLWTSTILPLLMLSKKTQQSIFYMNAPNFYCLFSHWMKITKFRMKFSFIFRYHLHLCTRKAKTW